MVFFAAFFAAFRLGLLFGLAFGFVFLLGRAAVRRAIVPSFQNLDSFAISVVLSDAYRQ
jgi:hypothetical protein